MSLQTIQVNTLHIYAIYLRFPAAIPSICVRTRIVLAVNENNAGSGRHAPLPTMLPMSSAHADVRDSVRAIDDRDDVRDSAGGEDMGRTIYRQPQIMPIPRPSTAAVPVAVPETEMCATPRIAHVLHVGCAMASRLAVDMWVVARYAPPRQTWHTMRLGVMCLFK